MPVNTGRKLRGATANAGTDFFSHRGWRVGLMTLFILWVGLMGLAPHVAFSIKSGEVAFFQSAFDEPHYYFLSVDSTPAFWAKKSNLIILLSKIFAGNPSYVMMAMDFFCPMAIAAAALFIACRIFKSIPARVFSAVMMLFGQELISGGCASIYGTLFNNFYYPLSNFAKQFIPYFGSTFYSIYRTPEPQASYIPLFFLIGHVCHVLLRKGRFSALDWTIQIIGNAIVGCNYVFCAVPMGIFETVLCVIFLARRKWTTVLYFLVGGSALASSMLFMSFWIGKDLTSSYSSFVFSSRLPAITTSQICSLVLACEVIWLSSKKAFSEEEFPLCLAGMLIPFVLINQQIVTGLMVSTRDWEKYSVYPFLMLSVLLCGKALWRHAGGRFTALLDSFKAPALMRGLFPGAVVLGIVSIVTYGQLVTYRNWDWYNTMSFAYAKGIRSVLDKHDDVQFCVDYVMGEPLINMRFGRKLPFLLYFDDTVFHTIAPLNNKLDALPSGHEYYKARFFEYFARRGLDDKELSDLLRNELKTYSGFFLGFVFSPLDYTFVATDDRFYRSDDIARLIPLLAGEYNAYLSHLPAEKTRETFFLSTSPPGVFKAAKGFENTFISAIEAPSKIYLYRQKNVQTKQ
jgi:hypothetical protein